jgi:Arc/MetJ-type ribon-helix-helix transcriptional regulator
MRKTTVYLSDDEVEGLRRVAAETGASQSDLIRRGLRAVLG